jgi:hypothetical protein
VGTQSDTQAERTEPQEKSIRTVDSACADQKRNRGNKNGSIKMKLATKTLPWRVGLIAEETLEE